MVAGKRRISMLALGFALAGCGGDDEGGGAPAAPVDAGSDAKSSDAAMDAPSDGASVDVDAPGPMRTLTIFRAGDGEGSVTSSPAGIDCSQTSGTCTMAFPEGVSITLSAQAEGGSTLVGPPPGDACATGSVTLSSDVKCVYVFQRPSRFAYVANQQDDSISAYSMEGAAGLSPIGSAIPSGGTLPNGIAVERTGKYLYVSNRTGGIKPFSIAATGNLTALPAMGNGATAAVAVHPSGQWVYASVSSQNRLVAYSVESDGSLLDLGMPLTASSTIGGLAVHPEGKFLYVVSEAPAIELYDIDSAGALSARAGTAFSPGHDIKSLALEASGRFLYTAGTDGKVSIAAIGSDGTLVPIAGSPFDLGVDADGAQGGIQVTAGARYLYSIDSAGAELLAFSLSEARVPTLISGGPFTVGIAPTSVAVEALAGFVYVTNRTDNSTSNFRVGMGGALLALLPSMTEARPSIIVLSGGP